MNSKIEFAYELKNKVSEKEPFAQIGSWAHSVYLDLGDVTDVEFLNLLITLSTMELGSEFAFNYEELDKIANDLISGKDVKL